MGGVTILTDSGSENPEFTFLPLPLAGILTTRIGQNRDPSRQKLKNRKYGLPQSKAPFQMTWIIIK